MGSGGIFVYYILVYRLYTALLSVYWLFGYALWAADCILNDAYSNTLQVKLAFDLVAQLGVHISIPALRRIASLGFGLVA